MGEIELRIRRISDRIALAVCALAPLPFGSVEGIWITVWLGALVASSLLVWPLPRFAPADAQIVVPVVAVYIVVCALAIYQVWPNPPIGSVDPMWAKAREIFGEGPAPRISATRSGPVLTLVPVALAVLCFLRTYVLCRDAAQAKLLLHLMAVAGVIYALYGMIATLSDVPWLLWREKTAYLHSLTGTFVNRNTAATYFGSIGLVLLLLSFREWERRAPRHYRFVMELLDWVSSRDALRWHVWVAGTALTLGATLMTGSRAGVVATLAACVTCTALYWRRQFAGKLLGSWSGLAFILTLLIATEILGGAIAGRLENQGLEDRGRWEVYRICLTMIADHPWFGIGLGNFEAVFPRYRTAVLSYTGIWDKAHSTWLQLYVELGVPVASLVVGLVLWLGFCLFGGAAERVNRRVLPMAGFGVAMLAALHAAVDFSLQIPGYAVVVASIMACGLAQRGRDPPTSLCDLHDPYVP